MDYQQVWLANLNKVRVPELEDRWNLFIVNRWSNNSGIFRYAQDMNQVPRCSSNTMEMVDLPNSDCSVDFYHRLTTVMVGKI